MSMAISLIKSCTSKDVDHLSESEDITVLPILCGTYGLHDGIVKFDALVFGAGTALVLVGIGNSDETTSGMLTVILPILGAVVSAC